MSTQEATSEIEYHSSFVGAFLSIAVSYWYFVLTPFIFLRLVLKRYASPIRRYPGPFLASVTRLWKFRGVYNGQTHLDRIALHEQYGPIVRIAPNEVSIASPEAARLVLSAGKRFTKTRFYAVFPPVDNPDIFTEIRESHHASKKRVASGPYSMASMQTHSPYIDETIDLLCAKIDGSTNTGGGIGQLDLGKWLHFFAFDVVGKVAFSRSFGFLEQEMDIEGAIKTIDDMQRYNGLVGQIPEIDHLMRRNPIWRAFSSLRGLEAPLVTRMAMAEVEKRRPFTEGKHESCGGDSERRDLLASLIQGHLKKPEQFTEADVVSVAHGAIFAGSDSTASTMQSFFHLVLSHSTHYARLVTEISQAVADGRIPYAGNLTWANAQSLPYFQACLKEAMRLQPAVGLDITRIVPEPGVSLDGHFIPAGTGIAINGWVIHRDKTVFGLDADKFRPQRWLEDMERARVMDRHMYQFGGGAHVCIGRYLALLEMNKVLPRLLRDYSFSLVNPKKALKAVSTFFVVQEGLEVYIEKKTPTNFKEKEMSLN